MKRYGMGQMQNTEIYGPCFLPKPTLNGKSYKIMLRFYAMPKTADFPGSPVPHQDGAPSQMPIDVRLFLNT